MSTETKKLMYDVGGDSSTAIKCLQELQTLATELVSFLSCMLKQVQFSVARVCNSCRHLIAVEESSYVIHQLLRFC